MMIKSMKLSLALLKSMRSSLKWIKKDTLSKEEIEESKKFTITWKENMQSVESRCPRALTLLMLTIVSLKSGKCLTG